MLVRGKIICGAKTRRGTPCSSQYVMKNGRCRMHGGKSTGPKRAHKTHGAYELVTKHQRHPKPRPDAVSKMTEAELLRLSDLRELTDLQILHEQARITVVAIERLGLEHIDARSKLNGSLASLLNTAARVRGDPINVHTGAIPPSAVATLSDAQLMAIAATALELHAAGEPA
jgi:hypothetical protein